MGETTVSLTEETLDASKREPTKEDTFIKNLSQRQKPLKCQ